MRSFLYNNYVTEKPKERRNYQNLRKEIYWDFERRSTSSWKRRAFTLNVSIFEIHILEMWELGDIFNGRWTFAKLYPQKNNFWAPDEDRTRHLLMTGETLQPLSYQDSNGEPKCKYISNSHISKIYISLKTLLAIGGFCSGRTYVKFETREIFNFRSFSFY